MIVAEIKQMKILDKFDAFGEAMSDGKVYRLREAILLSKKLGRPLSKEEMKKFEV